MKKIISLSLIFVLLVSALCGCSSTKEFSKDGLTITLPALFQDLSDQSYAEGKAFLYGFGSTAVMGVKEEKAGLVELFGEDLTLEDYATLMIELNSLTCELTQKDGLWTFQYSADSEGTNYTYVAAVFETETDFWTVQTYCATSDYAKNAEAMWGYLTSVRVTTV